MGAAQFAASFVAAVLSLHEGLRALRAVWGDPSPERWLAAVGWGVLLLASGAWAGYVVYAADRKSGRVRRRVALYERWMAMQRGGRWP